MLRSSNPPISTTFAPNHHGLCWRPHASTPPSEDIATLSLRSRPLLTLCLACQEEEKVDVLRIAHSVFVSERIVLRYVSPNRDSRQIRLTSVRLV